jgi:hypothetical protein
MHISCKLIIVNKCMLINFLLCYFVVMADESKPPDDSRALVARNFPMCSKLWPSLLREGGMY